MRVERRGEGAVSTIGILLDGATGRLGRTQHLRALCEIREEGGLPLKTGERLFPEPVLLGRDGQKLAALAAERGGLRWSTDREASLADPRIEVYFDAGATGGRFERARSALAAGKQLFLEKPTAETLAEALELARFAKERGQKGGVVQDKLSLPGLKKLKTLFDNGFFGRVLSIRLDFGWWVFDGEVFPAQRPSWNYRKETGGGILLDMFPHWRYLFDRLLGRIESVLCAKATLLPLRRDEGGRRYEVDVEDSAFALFALEGGVVARLSASWATRVRRGDLLEIQVDGTSGSAVAGLHRCFIQPLVATPKPFFDPEKPRETRFEDGWQEMPELAPVENGYRASWEEFLRHLAEDAPFSAPLLEGAKGLQLAEACHQSHAERRWVDLPLLTL